MMSVGAEVMFDQPFPSNGLPSELQKSRVVREEQHLGGRGELTKDSKRSAGSLIVEVNQGIIQQQRQRFALLNEAREAGEA
jgi:hypothetical protein